MNGISYEEIDVCDQLKQQDIRMYMSYCHLSEEDFSKRFENSNYKNEKEKKFSESFQRYCKNFEIIKKKGLGIFMSGNPGTGKTYYSNCIMNALIHENKIWRTSLYEILQEIKSTFNKYSDKSMDFIFKKLKNADLVIFDDLGNEIITENWGKEQLFVIFDFIYQNKISFIINTNLDNNQFREFLKINGSFKLLDRIQERCKAYNFDWESRRKDLHKKDFEELY